jgi:hypothetical protein
MSAVEFAGELPVDNRNSSRFDTSLESRRRRSDGCARCHCRFATLLLFPRLFLVIMLVDKHLPCRLQFGETMAGFKKLFTQPYL